MQGNADRDRAIDQALRHTVGASPQAAPGECLDADVLAAWSEGTLNSDRAVAVESHLSSCARCQQMLAIFARTTPEPVAQEPLWRRWRLQWLVPIATAATAAAIWVASPRQDQTTVAPPVSDSATQSSASTVSPPQASAPSAPAQEARQFAAKETPSAPGASNTPAPATETKARSAVAPPPATEPPAQKLQKREELERRDAQAGNTTQQAPRAPGEVESDARARANEARDTFSPQPESLQTRPSSPATDAAASAAQKAAAPPAAAPGPAASPAPAAPPTARGGVRALGAAARFVPSAEIPSPNAQIRWRITGGQQVERTTNGGAQWQPATMPAASALTAGMSPSSTVCWIVGRAGALYVTADGLRFVRVNFPEAIDLVSVTATDDRHATVMSADGRSFTTADQGANWTR